MPAMQTTQAKMSSLRPLPDTLSADEKDFLLRTLLDLLPTTSWLTIINVLEAHISTLDFFSEGLIFFYRGDQLHVDPQFVKKTSTDENGIRNITQHLKSIFSGVSLKKWLKTIVTAEAYTIEQLNRPKLAADLHDFCLRTSVKNMAVIPLSVNAEVNGYILLFSQRRDMSLIQKNALLSFLGKQIAAAAVAVVALEDLQSSYNGRQTDIEKPDAAADRLLNDRSKVVGESEAMKAVFRMVMQVAETNTTVMLLGETGTGKEVFAEALHHNSLRRGKPLIKVNCAALPIELIESELFGHEKGSFTGAFERKIGRFELASSGTIFLDEIGELPINVQAKLLRVIQEGEFERIGGTRTLKTNVRIITATNRDLRKEITRGYFRSDLYFRLNVFPITLPPLRDRKDDIPPLVDYFLHKYAPFRSLHVSSTIMKKLKAYNWPGNVRELEHLIERTVLLVKGKILTEDNLPLEIHSDEQLLINRDVKTLDELEKEHIIAVLKMVNGKISGVGGAAEILKIPSTTLNSKMKRLKIKKELQLSTHRNIVESPPIGEMK
jgi:transcriptional regulator with GAF, ATPase, and Fis domain